MIPFVVCGDETVCTAGSSVCCTAGTAVRTDPSQKPTIVALIIARFSSDSTITLRSDRSRCLFVVFMPHPTPAPATLLRPDPRPDPGCPKQGTLG